MGTRSRVCHRGWEVWVHGVSAVIRMSKLIIVRSMVTYYVCCRNYMYICILILHIYNVQYYTEIWFFLVTNVGSLIHSSRYYIYYMCYVL